MLGRTSDVSYEGVTILLRVPIELASEEATEIFLTQGEEEIVLRARPIHTQPWRDSSRVGFKVVHVERGEQKWHQLCYVPSW